MSSYARCLLTRFTQERRLQESERLARYRLKISRLTRSHRQWKWKCWPHLLISSQSRAASVLQHLEVTKSRFVMEAFLIRVSLDRFRMSYPIYLIYDVFGGFVPDPNRGLSSNPPPRISPLPIHHQRSNLHSHAFANCLAVVRSSSCISPPLRYHLPILPGLSLCRCSRVSSCAASALCTAAGTCPA